ncbi:hypothetical protein OSTOST_07585, partial [Ostertagia ostertagi]
MLFALLSSVMLIRNVWAGAVDLNCTIYDGGALKYADSAVNCEDKLSTANCAILYPKNPSAAAGAAVDRDPKCGGDQAIDPQLVQAAVDLCPKTCGYCCLTPAFSCNDKLQPRIPCSSVTKVMCENNAWKKILRRGLPENL